MIRTVSAERVRDELNRIFTVAKPEKGLDLLDQSGLLAHVLPDIAALHGVEQPPQFHPEGDVFEHTRLMLTKVQQPDLELALGILFHDVARNRPRRWTRTAASASTSTRASARRWPSAS